MKQNIYLAGGCFWGVQKFFDAISGVVATAVGYANGLDCAKAPTYEEVYTGTTGFAETLYVMYDSDVISLRDILLLYGDIIEPTSLNKQGDDTGTHYRTGVFFDSPDDEAVIAEFLAELQRVHDAPVVVENLPLTCFYRAEEHHQRYLDKNPGGYCHIPAEKFRANSEDTTA